MWMNLVFKQPSLGTLFPPPHYHQLILNIFTPTKVDTYNNVLNVFILDVCLIMYQDEEHNFDHISIIMLIYDGLLLQFPKLWDTCAVPPPNLEGQKKRGEPQHQKGPPGRKLNTRYLVPFIIDKLNTRFRLILNIQGT